MKAKYLIIAVVLLITFVVGLNMVIDKKSKTSTASLAQPALQQIPKVSIGSPAPDFTLTDTDGKQFSLKAETGIPVILFGMASWCGECIGEGQALTKIQQTYGSKVQIIGVAFTPGDTNATIKQFKQLGSVNLPIAVDTDNVTKKYNLVNLDTTYFINKQGSVAYKSEGAMSYSDIQQQLDKIL